MIRNVDQVLESIDASIEDTLHHIMGMEDERGYELEEFMIELTFLIKEYRKLRITRNLDVLHHRIKENHVY